jgi:ATP:ADP antiporter, AAA family
LFISGNAIRKCGWTFTALLTPMILLITSVGFFTFFFLDEIAPMGGIFLGLSPLALVVFFGSAQNILSRGAKYSVFDATKEMSFVPLKPESKLIGKAAIDGICSRLGKSGGSVVHQSFLILFSTITASAPYVAMVLFIVIIIWVVAVRLLGKQFNELINEHTHLDPVSVPISPSDSTIEPQVVASLRSVSVLNEPNLLKAN